MGTLSSDSFSSKGSCASHLGPCGSGETAGKYAYNVTRVCLARSKNAAWRDHWLCYHFNRSESSPLDGNPARAADVNC
ncbi:Uncharacterised protein [Vibrio cholerae]|nr:Uncharacterised protein [Vibrio cholerae]